MRDLVVAPERRPLTIDTPRDPLVVHVARVLVLIDAFTGPTSALRGLAKLARLDFLLRFPVYLEAALSARDRPLAFDLRATYTERRAPEGARIRWKYGPWDHRYYPLLGRLVGQGLISPERMRGELLLRSTQSGRDAVASLEGPEWALVRGRARALKRGADLRADRLGGLIVPLLEAEELR
jgi:hypothetical protein